MDAELRKSLDRFFSPKSLAIVGVSGLYSGNAGEFLLRNLLRANFPGRIYLVDPVAQEMTGLRIYPKISNLPEAIDLAIICVPADFVSSALAEFAQNAIRNIHILTSGFKELATSHGLSLEKEIQNEISKGQLNVIGPNCIGPYVPASPLMLWGQIPASPGALAFLSQDDYLSARMTKYAHFMGCGISKALSFGSPALLDSTDFLEYLAEDGETKVIGMYLEGVRDGRRFLQVANRVNRIKPLVI